MVISNDEPGTDPAGDRLRRAPFAEQVAALVAKREDPTSLVLSINGAWGEGKSTVLNYIRHYLRGHVGIETTHFNPWQFASLTEMQIGFYGTLASTVSIATRTKSQKAGDLLGKYASLLQPLALVTGGSDVSGSVSKFAEYFSETSIDDIKRRVGEELARQDVRVVVLIDDLDRVEPQELRQLLKMIKLTADFDRTVYILAFDETFVARSVGKFFDEKTPLHAGKEYLEKLIHLPLRIPLANPVDLREMCVAELTTALREANCEFAESDRGRFSDAFELHVLPEITTPRTAKKLGGYVRAVLPLLRHEVNIADYVLLECMRLVFPSIYEDIRSHPSTYVGSAVEIAASSRYGAPATKERIESTLANLGDRSRGNAERLLIAMFPQLEHIIGTEDPRWNQVTAEEARQGRGIANENYLPKYFFYGVPRYEVPDETVNGFLDEAQNQTVDEIVTTLGGFLSHDLLTSLIIKLSMRGEGSSVSKSAAIAIARIANQLPVETQDGFGLFMFTPCGRAAWVAANTVRSQSRAEDRTDLLAELLSESTELLFSDQVLRILEQWGGESKDLVTDAAGIDVANRAAAEAETDAFFEDSLRFARLLPLVQRHLGSDHSRKLVRTKLHEKPAHALSLVRVFFPDLLLSELPEEEKLARARELVNLEDLAAACSAAASDGGEQDEFARRFLAWWETTSDRPGNHNEQ